MIGLRMVERANLGMEVPLDEGGMSESGNVRSSTGTMIVIWTASKVVNFWVILRILS